MVGLSSLLLLRTDCFNKRFYMLGNPCKLPIEKLFFVDFGSMLGTLGSFTLEGWIDQAEGILACLLPNVKSTACAF